MPKTVVKEPPKSNGSVSGEYILYMSSVADVIPAWGTAPAQRDMELRTFWPTEPILASALFSTASRYAAFEWHLDGPERMVNMYTKLLHSCEQGKGWIELMMKVLTDLFTQDNGAFIEVVRVSDSATSPVVSLNHLDSAKCIRTGRREAPVVYFDREGSGHELKWYQVIPIAEFPSPIERMRGMQYCAITRMLRAAQILRDISVFKSEKLSGRFSRAIHLVSGVQKRTLDDAITIRTKQDTEAGLTRYVQPMVIASLDPTATVTVATIQLASLPDGFDEEVAMRWYVNQLALAFANDYQDFAPLPGGNLGSSQQSETLHMKSRGRGPKLFMTMMMNLFNYLGILPNSLLFVFGDQDLSEDTEKVKLRQARALERKLRIESGEITPEVARLIAVSVGDLDPDYLPVLAAADAAKLAALAAGKNIPGPGTDKEETATFNQEQPPNDNSKFQGNQTGFNPKVQ